MEEVLCNSLTIDLQQIISKNKERYLHEGFDHITVIKEINAEYYNKFKDILLNVN